MKQPHEMNDSEINLEIAQLYYPDAKCRINMIVKSIEVDRLDTKLADVIDVNYTNNIADIFPIMVELRIDLIFPEETDSYIAEKINYTNITLSHEVVSLNPLRAICECVLLVLRSKNDG